MGQVKKKSDDNQLIVEAPKPVHEEKENLEPAKEEVQAPAIVEEVKAPAMEEVKAPVIEEVKEEAAESEGPASEDKIMPSA